MIQTIVVVYCHHTNTVTTTNFIVNFLVDDVS